MTTQFIDIDKVETFKFENLNIEDLKSDLINKLKYSKARQSKRNTEREQADKPVVFCFIGYYNINDVRYKSVNYPKQFDYKVHIKCENLKEAIAKEAVKYCIEWETKNNSKVNSLFIEDDRMKKIYENSTNDTSNGWVLYYLRIVESNILKDLFQKGCYVRINSALRESLLPFYNQLNDEPNTEKKVLILDKIIQVLKLKIEKTPSSESINEKWIKSEGEFYTLITLLLMFNIPLLINSELISNPLTKRRLEYDFYINSNTGYTQLNMVVEVNGGHHKEDKQKNTDKIKKILTESDAISLVSIDTSNKSYKIYITSLFEEIQKVLTRQQYNVNSISLESIIKTLDSFNMNSIRSKWNYTLNNGIIERNYMNSQDNFSINMVALSDKYNILKKKEVEDVVNRIITPPNTNQ